MACSLETVGKSSRNSPMVWPASPIVEQRLERHTVAGEDGSPAHDSGIAGDRKGSFGHRGNSSTLPFSMQQSPTPTP